MTMLAQFAAAGGGTVPAYIEDVFSTYLYTGTGAAQTINNGIDVTGKGGLVWLKNRTTSPTNHGLFDTARGDANYLCSDLTDGQFNYPNNGITFSNTGFNIDAASYFGGSGAGSGDNYASWTFRKQPKFFDVVTYTGTGSNRTVAHNLDSVPGCIMVKRTDTTGAWQVYHRSLANTEYVVLNTTAAVATGATRWNSTDPTSTVFTVGTDATVNASGGTYVAYIFAHDSGGFGPADSDNVISCGSLYTDGSGNASVTLGYEPQWLLVKKYNGLGNWILTDVIRGSSNTSSAKLLAQTTGAETVQASGTSSAEFVPTATGFDVRNNATGTSAFCIYIAIRRGPMKIPTDGTKVFQPVAYTGTSATRTVTGVGFPFDMNITMDRAAHTYNVLSDRLRGLNCNGTLTQPQLYTNATTQDTLVANGINGALSSAMDGYTIYNAYSQLNVSPDTYISYNYRRAPSFFDEVCYTGTGTTFNVNHNLGVVPELLIAKHRSTTGNWSVMIPNATAASLLYLNLTNAANTGIGAYVPTATTFPTFVNTSGVTEVAYLFATCAGVSKVGSYTGTGTTKQIDCGFAAGARFVLIKRTDSTGDWYVWDSARGIVAGNDPYSLLNTSDAEVTSTDYVDTYAAGFELTSTAPAALNASGGTYIFLAIA